MADTGAPRFAVRWDDARSGSWRIWDTARGAWVDGRQFYQECLGLPATAGPPGEGPRFRPGSFPHARRLVRRMNEHTAGRRAPDRARGDRDREG